MTSPTSADPSARPYRLGFTLLEVLTTLAFLVVVMGLMVSLARYVRAQSAQQYTRRLLAELDQAQRLYADSLGTFLQATGVNAPPLSAEPGEAEARDYVQRVNGPYIAELLAHLHPGEKQSAVRDAWGNPVGFLPAQNPRIGMAPQNQPFFFSAGPDGRFLTRQDNLYSYEQIKPGYLPDLPQPMPATPINSVLINTMPLDTANNELAPSAARPSGDHGGPRERP